MTRTSGVDPRSPSMILWHRLLAVGVSEDEAAALMHGYAHELAERQREDIDYESGNSTPDFIAGRLSGADLIDPKAQRASTEGDTP